MSCPVILWILINNFVVKGSATAFSGIDLAALGILAGFMVVSFYLLSTWMHRQISATGGK
jgi:hypothetical protein